MSTGRFDSVPCRSVRKRLSARIAMGRSISPRRQAVSQGCAQTRPQMLASGLGSRATCSLLKSPFRDERDIPARVRVGWTSHHAGEVGVQPIPVHFFVLEPFQQDGNPQCVRLMESILLEEGTGRRATWPPAPLFSYLLRVKSALLLPATATGLDWFLAPSCHTVTV